MTYEFYHWGDLEESATLGAPSCIEGVSCSVQLAVNGPGYRRQAQTAEFIRAAEILDQLRRYRLELVQK
jgi:hypothetical protein